jgi:UDP-glucuronate 4-epimerase
MNFFITGTAGFIGYHLADMLLQQGHTVHGYDGMTDYYDVRLKRARHQLLQQYPSFRATEALLENATELHAAIDAVQPQVIVHLAAQAGVRYSIDNPRAYIDANIVGTFNVMEGARTHKVKHLLMASTSSVYGANTEMPYSEVHKADTQMSFYAATKKATEVMAHSYAHIHGIPTTMFRFFTVYGPWGRPDMALFKFTKNILEGKPIDIYNHGNMWRDFTYVSDLVRGIGLLIEVAPPVPGYAAAQTPIPGDSLSITAPWRVVNIGNSDKVRLLDFVEAIEESLGMQAIRNYMDMQPGDVPATWANASLLQQLTGYKPQTNFKKGVQQFVDWYRGFYAPAA